MNSTTPTLEVVISNGRNNGHIQEIRKVETATTMNSIGFEVRDNSGLRRFTVRNYRGDATIGELVRTFVDRLGLRRVGADVADEIFHAFSGREGRHLRSAEIVADVIQQDDEITLHPDVQAG